MPFSSRDWTCTETLAGILKVAEPFSSTGTVPSTFFGMSFGTVIVTDGELDGLDALEIVVREAVQEAGLMTRLAV